MSDSRFPPAGRRGFGSPFAPSHWGLTSSEYFSASNENVLVMIQIETKEAVDNLEEIAKVSGLGKLTDLIQT